MMIDIHTHILPGVDDGVQRLEESLQILKAFEASGVKTVFVTPHVAPKRGYLNTTESLTPGFESLVKATIQEGINVDLILASEIDEADDMYQLLDSIPRMNDHTVMVDFGMRKADIESVIYELKVRGYQTIIAHPERLFYMTIEQVRNLKKQGALMQVSAPHLIKYGSISAQKLAMKMLKEQLIDFVGTDIHQSSFLDDALEKAYKVVKKKVGEGYAALIFNDNAARLLNDDT